MKSDSARILVVDDDVANGEFLQEQLKGSRCRVDFFSDPRRALAQFRKGAYHMAILDVRMPKMNGEELFHRLRAQDPGLRVIMLTAYPSVDSVLATLKTGAYDYLRKPYKIDELRTIVNRILEEKGFFLATEQVINRHIGARVKQYRVRKGWTVSRLAAQTQLSKSLISQIENAKNSASLVSLMRMARALSVRARDLVQDL